VLQLRRQSRDRNHRQQFHQCQASELAPITGAKSMAQISDVAIEAFQKENCY
jgi:hypothetical protein